VSSNSELPRVNDDVARFKQWNQMFDEFVTGLPALTSIITRRGFFQFGNHFFNRMCADDFGAFGFVGEKVVTFSTVRLNATTTVKPWSFMLRNEDLSMTANPISAMSACSIKFMIYDCGATEFRRSMRA